MTYLVFLRLVGSMALLASSSAPEGAERLVLRQEVAVLRRQDPGPRLDWAGRPVPHRVNAAVLGQRHGGVEGRRHAIPDLSGMAPGRRERRRVPPAGDEAIVTGRPRQRSYETNDGEKRTVYEPQVDEADPSLRNATAKVTRASHPGNGQSADTGEASGSYGDEPPF